MTEELSRQHNRQQLTYIIYLMIVDYGKMHDCPL